MGNKLLERAAHSRPAMSKRGMLERLFTLMFQGFVYNQIWEDPEVDLKAMRVGPSTRIVTIASGGCNVLNYLAADPKSITAIDLNPNHIALTRLKLAGLRHLPTYEDFFRFFGMGDYKGNLAAYDKFIAPNLDEETRKYWETRVALHGRRINMFARNLYRYSLLGRFIGLLHVMAKFYGKNPKELLEARTPEEQREIFNRTIAPIFDTRIVKALSKMPVAVYGLGIPPNQYDELVSASNGNVATLFRERLARLACDFPINDNYFAWQAFGRGYDVEGREAVPDYLRKDTYALLRQRIDRVETKLASMTDYLGALPEKSRDRYVLLDAQDWMTVDQITALWRQITRTASDEARVIFRTAGEESPLEKKLPPEIIGQWAYEKEESLAFHRQDRSSIYGGFHIYVKKPN
jgi:S-adenosylmethionine-diacylglycerol 3-amino-3-carboxypropyl transferase